MAVSHQSALAQNLTLLDRQNVPISEGKSIIRSRYRSEPTTVGGTLLSRTAGVPREATTVTQEVIVVGPGVNYDANRGVGAPQWVRSDAALAPSAKTGVAFESTQSPLEVTLPSSADGALTVAKNGRSVTSRFLGASASRPETTNAQTAKYANAFRDTDLVWQVSNGFLKESLILHSPNAPSEFFVSLDLNGLQALRPDGARCSPLPASTADRPTSVSGLLVFGASPEKKDHHFLMPPATIEDAAGKKSLVDCFISQSGKDSLILTLRVPKRFLSRRDLKYPLTLDPSFITVTDNSIKTFEAGKTYYIAGWIYYYDLADEVRIEGTAILKFKPWIASSYGSLCLFGSASIKVQGSPYNYAYFTSAYDDSIGADTDGSGLPIPEGQPALGDCLGMLSIAANVAGGATYYEADIQ